MEHYGFNIEVISKTKSVKKISKMLRDIFEPFYLRFELKNYLKSSNRMMIHISSTDYEDALEKLSNWKEKYSKDFNIEIEAQKPIRF